MHLPNRGVLLLITTLLVMPSVSGPAAAQEPEDIGVPYAIEAGSGKLVPLERQPYNVGAHIKALGFGGAQGVVRFNGKTSPVQIKAANDLRFAIRFVTVPVIPSEAVNLDVLTAKKDSREAVMMKISPMGFGAKSTRGETTIDIKFRSGENSVLYFQPTTPLAPGEYVITFQGTHSAYLFTILP